MGGERDPELGAALEERGPRLRPRGAGEVLDAAAELLCERFAACVLPVAVTWCVAQVATRWVLAPLEQDAASAPTLPELWLLAYSSWILSLAVGVFTTAGLAPIVAGDVAGERVGLGAALGLLARRAPALFVVTASVALLAALGLFPFVVPGLFVLWKLLFAGAVCTVEGASPFASLGRSLRLTRGGFLRWLPVFLVAYAATVPFSAGAGALHDGASRGWLAELVKGAPPGGVQALAIVGSSLLLAIPTAFYALVVGVFYVDARVRHEGFDLVQRLARLEARHVGEGPPGPLLEAGGERGLA